MDIMTVNGVEYTVLQLLGKGKGGYSYLAKREKKQVVLKQIHHEPCDYYTFGNKIEAERNDYERLKNADIRIPEMIDIDIDGFGSYKLYFVPHAKDIESELLRFFDVVMDNT